MNTLIRTQISLQRDQRQEAGRIATWQSISFAQVVRQALADYISKVKGKQTQREATIKRLAGVWKNSSNWKGVDAVAWQRKLRREKGI